MSCMLNVVKKESFFYVVIKRNKYQVFLGKFGSQKEAMI